MSQAKIIKTHQAHFTRVDLVQRGGKFYVRSVGDMFEPNLVRFTKDYTFRTLAIRKFNHLCDDAEVGLIA